MPKMATKAAGNIFYQARKEASSWNDRLSSREGAAEETGVDRTRLAYIELNTVNPHPEEVLILSDTYNAPELCNHFCSKMCPLGVKTINEVEIGELEKTVLQLLSAFQSLPQVKSELIDIAADGVIYDVGMPIGNLTSQLFANIYLNELDQHCKHDLHLHYYIRYMDDIIILHNDKRYLQSVKDDIEVFLKEALHLDLNNKTAIRPTSLGIDFVGYRIYATHRILKRSTARRIIRSVTSMSKSLADGTLTRADFDRRVASYKGILEHCNSHGLRRRLNENYKKYALCGKGENPNGNS